MKESCFRDLEGNDRFGLKAGHLAAEFRSDRARSSGNQDHAAVQFAADRTLVETHRFPTEQVFYSYIAYVIRQTRALDDVRQGRYGAERHTHLLTPPQDFDHLGTCRRGNGNQDLIDVFLPYYRGKITARIEHGHLFDQQASFARIVVDKGANGPSEFGGHPDVAEEADSCPASAVDQNHLRWILTLRLANSLRPLAGHDAQARGCTGT